VLPDYQRQLHDIVTQVRNNVFSFPNFLSRKKMIGQDRLGNKSVCVCNFFCGGGGSTQENCASACFDAKRTVAGIDGGNHCWCGGPLAAGAGALKRPASECEVSACHGNHAEKCGGTNRLKVYSFHCSSFSSSSSSAA
jgi:hypothetical protein